jgi:enoyl-CoA hydratase
MSDVFSIDRDGHVATVWLDNPDRRNAMGSAFFEGIKPVFDDLADDPDVWAIVLAAKGPAFTVGLDLKEVGGGLSGGLGAQGAKQGSDASRRLTSRRQLLRWQEAFTAVADCPKPVIAAIHGWCIGGGIDLICCADIRLASADTRFSVRETKVAIVADLGTLQRLPKILAPGHVAELAFTGKDITADRAAEIGLVNEVAGGDADSVYRAARALADEIASNPPLVVQGVKQVLRAGRELTVEQGLDYVSLWNSAFLGTNDLVEAMTSFMEKRPPNYSGT